MSIELLMPAGESMPKVFSPVVRMFAAGVFIATVLYIFKSSWLSPVAADDTQHTTAQK